jgi:hypothetical protein
VPERDAGSAIQRVQNVVTVDGAPGAPTRLPPEDFAQSGLILEEAEDCIMRNLGNGARAQLQAFGIVALSSTPSEFDRYYRSEVERWSKVFRDRRWPAEAWAKGHGAFETRDRATDLLARVSNQ